MKYYYTLDSLNRFTSIVPENQMPEEGKNLSYFESDQEPNYFWGIHGIINNEILYIGQTPEEIERDKPNQKNIKLGRLEELKNFLKETDYKVIKCYEASLLNEEIPYNLQELLAQRKAWRDEINALEFEISMLGN
jgi:hypothetical protein